MGLYIKGIEMPENCSECPVALSSGKYCRINKTNETFRVLQIRPDHCPLVDLGKHGRLIDADADSLKGKLKFINEAEHQIYGRESWGFTAKCIYAIDDAPTVIEAEGTDEGSN